MRVLGIDLGDKRTGVASGDSITGVASPLDVLEVPIDRDTGRALLDALARIVAEHRPDRLVVGLPLNMDDSEGPGAKKARAFAARLAERLGPGAPAIDFQDERLTSADADWAMAQSGLTRGQKKARRDALAAAAIVRDYLANLPDGPTPSAGRDDPPGGA